MRQQRGFTLIELMIVVGVIAILAATAIPNYLEQSRKGRRSEAMDAVGSVQMALERWRAENTSYAGCASCTTGVATSNYSPVGVSNATGTSYTITATPTGKQLNDRCGYLVATHQQKPRWEKPVGTPAADCNN